MTDMAINTRSDSEHRYLCPWVWMLRIVHYLRSRIDEEQAKILGGGVAPPLRKIKPIAGERSVRLEALADKSEVALTKANGGNRFHGTVDMLEAILRPSEAEPEA